MESGFDEETKTQHQRSNERLFQSLSYRLVSIIQTAITYSYLNKIKSHYFLTYFYRFGNL